MRRTVCIVAMAVLMQVVAGCTGRGRAAGSTGPNRYTDDKQLVIACFRLDVDAAQRWLGSGADVNRRSGIGDGATFADKWVVGGCPPMGSENWTPLLALANSPRIPDPERPFANTTEGAIAAEKARAAIPKAAILERDRRRMTIARLLLSRHPDLNLDDGHGATALYCAVHERESELAILLIKAGANVNTKIGPYIDGPGDETPLHRSSDQPAVMRALLAHGANPNATTGRGDTPLHLAAGDLEAEQLLIVAGANVNARNKRGKRRYIVRSGVGYSRRRWWTRKR